MRSDETGTGVIGTVFGVLVFLVLLMLAAQVLLGLYATSVVTAATYDAAKAVAGADASGAVDDAETNARNQLGRFGKDISFTWQLDEDAVRLTVRAPRPLLLPVDPLPGDIVRTVRVRTERVR